MPDTGFTRFDDDAYVSDGKPLSKYDEFYPVHRWRNYLGWAIVLSLVLHLLGAPIVAKFRIGHAQPDEPHSKVSLEKIAVVTPKPTPVPTPTPQFTPPPKKPTAATPKPQALKLSPPKQTAHNTNGASHESRFTGGKTGVSDPQGDILTNGDGSGKSQGAAAPGPSAAPKAACAEPNVDARTVRKATPDYPEAAAQLGAVGTVSVKVSLSPTGAIVDATIYRTSGNRSLDAAGLLAAKQSTYAPEIKDCQPVAGSYVFVAEFATN